MKRILFVVHAWAFVLVFAASAMAQTNDPLLSWNEGATKQAIIQFVKEMSAPGGVNFVAPCRANRCVR